MAVAPTQLWHSTEQKRRHQQHDCNLDKMVALKSVQANGASEAVWAVHYHAIHAHQQFMQQLQQMPVQESASSIDSAFHKTLGFVLLHILRPATDARCMLHTTPAVAQKTEAPSARAG